MENKEFFKQHQITAKQYENIKDLLDGNDDMEMVSILISLNKLKFSKEEIKLFIKYPLSLKKNLLKKQRLVLLDKAHDYYKLVDLLDYMLYEMEEENNE